MADLIWSVKLQFFVNLNANSSLCLNAFENDDLFKESKFVKIGHLWLN